MKKTLLSLVIFKLLLNFYFSAFADATEAQIQVTASIEPACTITASNLNFGPYNYAESHETATLGILCTNGTKFRIGINEGSAPDASITSRAMSNSTNVLRYSLYSDPPMRMIWGADSSNSLNGIGTGKIEYYKVYGKIMPDQKLPAGLYRDNVMISVILDGLAGFGYQLSIGMAVAATIRP